MEDEPQPILWNSRISAQLPQTMIYDEVIQDESKTLEFSKRIRKYGFAFLHDTPCKPEATSLAMSLFITSLFCIFHVRLSVSVLFCVSLRTRALIVLSSIQNYLHFFCIMKRVTRHAQTRSLHCPNYAKCDNLILAISKLNQKSKQM